jgi:hypothetical protein
MKKVTMLEAEDGKLYHTYEEAYYGEAVARLMSKITYRIGGMSARHITQWLRVNRDAIGRFLEETAEMDDAD